MTQLLMFILAVIGLTNIVVDPAKIMRPVRDLVANKGPAWLDSLLSCYQCFGFWAGMLCGAFFLSYHPGHILMSGFAGSFIATFGATFLNYLEARSIIDIGDDNE